MGITDRDMLKGKLEVQGSPSSICWGKPAEFIKALTKVLTVKFPVNTNNDFVVVGHEPPSTDDKGRMWAKLSPSRNWLGWHAFIKGQWRRTYAYHPSQIIWMTGDSDIIPDGFQLVDASAPLHPDVISSLTEQYVPFTAGGTRYRYFAVRFVGY